MVRDRYYKVFCTSCTHIKEPRDGFRYILLSVKLVPGRWLAVGFLLCFQSEVFARYVVITGLDPVCDLCQEVCLFLLCLPGHTEALSTWTQ